MLVFISATKLIILVIYYIILTCPIILYLHKINHVFNASISNLRNQDYFEQRSIVSTK